MLKWLLRKKMTAVVDKDIEDARSALTAVFLQSPQQSPNLNMAYAEGIRETAGLLAQRFGISVPNALEATGFDRRQLDDACIILRKAMKTARPLLRSESEAMRIEARKRAAGCVFFSHLYRLRFRATQAPEEQKARLTQAAEIYVQFARRMSEIGAGTRDPGS
jgi:hypothetical protein